MKSPSARTYTKLVPVVLLLAAIVGAGIFTFPDPGLKTITVTDTSFTTETTTITSIVSEISTTTLTHTAITTAASTTIVAASTIASSPNGPTVYQTGQVTPIDISAASGPGTVTTFSPSAVRLVIGVNNTIAFVNDGSTAARIGEISAPANDTALSTPILSAGENYTLTLSSPGLYNYTENTHPDGVFGTILVVALPGILASTSDKDIVSIGGLSVCASCQPEPTFSADLVLNASSPLSALVLYVNGTFEGRTPINSTAVSNDYAYNVDLAESYIPIQTGKTYFVEVVAIFADDQLALATALAPAT